MERNIEAIKEKIKEKLPELLPKVVKSIVVHVVMFIYHISMQPWVTVMKIKKSLRSNHMDGDGKENYRKVRRRRLRRQSL